MKKKRLSVALLAAILCLCVALTAACTPNEGTPPGPKPPATSDWTEVPQNTNKNLKYFGYFHSDGFQSQGSYIDEIASLENANVLMINSSGGAALLENLEKAKSYNMKVILSVHGLTTGGQVKVPNSASLVSNYREVFHGITDSIIDYINDGTILSFYFDEPCWNGIGQEEFRTITKMMREEFPAVKVMQTMTSYDLGISKYEGFSKLDPAYNEYVTDVMYDNYTAWKDDTRKDWLKALKDTATNGQYIWGCPKGFSTNPEIIDEMVDHIKGMYTEALNEPRYAGIISFSYADGIKADWGYGLHSFFNTSSDYYSRELKELYIDIGREIIGLPAYDHSKTIDLMLVEPTEVYELGETVELPSAGAVDSEGNVLEVTYTVTSPSGVEMEAENFVAEESGQYVITVSVGTGANIQTKSTVVSVRYPNEISTFDAAAYNADSTGTDADVWCWPHQVDTTFSHTGRGSLKVTPHPTDGTWPRLIFARNGYTVWDISEYDYISMWVYNDGAETIKNFYLWVDDENMSRNNEVTVTKDLPSHEWVELTLSVASISSKKPDLDLTKVSIIYGNMGSTYPNRSIFHVDDVMLKKEEAQPDPNVIDFEFASDIDRVYLDADDRWGWGPSISSEQKHGGSNALKLDVLHDGDTQWPNATFMTLDGSEIFDFTNIEKVSLWVYIDSDGSFPNGNRNAEFGFKFHNGKEGTQYINSGNKAFTIEGKTWTELTITKAEILQRSANIDITQVRISFSSLGSSYTKPQSVIYLDDFVLTPASEEDPEPEPEPVDPTDYNTGFESSADNDRVGGTAADRWAWLPGVSDEQAHTGTGSLKITIANDPAGNWPNVQFKNHTGTETFDLTNVEKISIWIYINGDGEFPRDYENEQGETLVDMCLGLKINNGEDVNQCSKTFTIQGKTWTELTITKEEILQKSPNIDIKNVRISVASFGAVLASPRVGFYLDDLTFTPASEEEDPEPEPEPVDPTDYNFDFEDSSVSRIGTNKDDVWTWPFAVSSEQAHGGEKSLKVTVRSDGGYWPNVVFNGIGADTFDLTNVEKISLWVYFDSEDGVTASGKTQLGFKIDNGEDVKSFTKRFDIPARTWTELTVTKEEILNAVADIDLTAARVCFSCMGPGKDDGGYDNRANFYLDDLTFTPIATEEPETPEVPETQPALPVEDENND